MKEKTKKEDTSEREVCEIECCVSCGEETPYDKNTNIYMRSYYIQGAGQLCKLCYTGIYPD
jgi:hypothetical protein